MTTTPTIGTHGSFSVGSDRFPCTVVEVSKSGHRVVVEEDRVTEWEPHPSGYPVSFARREGGPRVTFTRRKNGSYRRAGTNGYGSGVSFGEWGAYHDPHF